MPELGYLKANLSFLHAIDSLRKKKTCRVDRGYRQPGAGRALGSPTRVPTLLELCAPTT